MSTPLTRDQILRAFTLLDRRLARRHVRGEILIAGGAVMALLYDADRVTRDVDGMIEQGHGALIDAARQVAAELGLPRGWLNEGVTAYLSTQPDERTNVFDATGLAVYAVSAGHMLALKARASRAVDLDDLQTLASALGIDSAVEVLDVVQQFFPDDLISPRARAVLEDLFAGSG